MSINMFAPNDVTCEIRRFLESDKLSWRRVIKKIRQIKRGGEPVWHSGKALGWQPEGPRFESASALLSRQKLWSVDAAL